MFKVWYFQDTYLDPDKNKWDSFDLIVNTENLEKSPQRNDEVVMISSTRNEGYWIIDWSQDWAIWPYELPEEFRLRVIRSVFSKRKKRNV